MTSIYVDVLHRMMDRLSSKIFLSFNLICLSAAIALTAYWIYVYTLNEDLVTVDYRKYYAEEPTDKIDVNERLFRFYQY